MKILSVGQPFLLSLVLLAAALAVSPVQAEPDRFAGKTWAFTDMKQTLAAAADITLAKYPDCDEATVDEKIVEDYRADGTGEQQDEAFVKVLTEKGKRDRRTLALSYLLPYFTVSVVKLEVIKPTGEVVPVDVAANSKDTIDTSQMDSNIYDPDSKILQVNIPGLEIGDVVHWVTRQNIERPIIPGEFDDTELFEGDSFVKHLVYEVHAPLDKPLKKIVLRDEIPGTVKYTTQPGDDKTLVHRWEVTDVPRMFDEDSMPPYENVLQRVGVSTTGDWHDISKWYWNLSKPHLDTVTPEMKKTVADLTAKSTTDLDKVKALFYYVSQNIRYMGLTPEKDRPGFEPHDCSLTFSKKYGVCRDKAALLVAMLRTAGFDAYPVLISVGPKKDNDVPDPGFNHAIVGVELKKGEYTLMDPTDEHARDLLPWHDGNLSYLVCRPEGETIKLSPVVPPENNLMWIRTTGVLSASGSLKAKTLLEFRGANDDIYRNGFAAMKGDDVQRYFEKCLKKAMPGAKLTSLKLTPDDMQDVSKEIRAEMEFTVDGMTATGHGKSVVSVPWIGNNMGLVNFILRGAELDKRKYPLQTEVPCGLDEQVSLQLADGFAGADSLPVVPSIDDDTVGYSEKFNELSGVLTCARELKLKVVEFSPSQYLELKQTLKDLEYDARKSPVLAMKDQAAVSPEVAADPGAVSPVESNADILDSEKTLTVTSPHDAVYHVKYAKKILTYAGKSREAEVKIDYNPACETASFIHGVVTSATGKKQEIAKDEINIMDADWSASAKRYTGGKILVANLPGVDIGSTIEVEYEITMKGMPYVAGFEPFQFPDNLETKSFVLHAPQDVNVQTQSNVPASTPFTWHSEQIKALPAETQLPPTWVYEKGVSYFAGDFKAYLKDLSAMMDKRSQTRTQVDALVKTLTGKTQIDTVKAIRDYVAKTIREAGPSFTDLPLSELSAADTTLSDGYGHEADRAILLQAMLRSAGFQAEFVLASDLPAVDGIQKTATTFPLPDSFDTPMVKLTLDGTTYYLNDTDQYAQLGSTPHDGKLGIDLSTGDYEVIKAAKDCQDRTETDYTLTFADDGKLQMGIQTHYFGDEFNVKNRFFSELRPEERKRYFQEAVSKIDQGARPVGDLSNDFGTYPGTEKFTVQLDNYAVVDGNYLYFNMPFTPSLFQLPGGDRRSLPFMLSQQASSSIRTEIDLPPGFRNLVIVPKNQDLAAPMGGGKATLTSSNDGGKFIMTDDFQTSPAIISPEDYPAMLKVESTLEKKSAKVFLLQKE